MMVDRCGHSNIIKEENLAGGIKDEIKTDDSIAFVYQPNFCIEVKKESKLGLNSAESPGERLPYLESSHTVPGFEKARIKEELQSDNVNPLNCCSAVIGGQPDAIPLMDANQYGSNEFSMKELAGHPGHAELPKIAEGLEVGTCIGMTEFLGFPGFIAGNWKKPFVCDLCNYTTNKAGNMKTHKMTHSGERPFICDICESRFTTAGNLKTHKLTHSGERPFVCGFCEARFSQVSHLRNHKLTHTGERPFICDICNSRFAVAGSLKRHKLIHSEEKPYACDLCGSRFSQATHLKNHKMRHTGEKPFACDVCGATSITAGNLRRHKKTHDTESVLMVEHPPSSC